MTNLILDKALVLPDSAFDIIEHLDLSDKEQAKWAWYELSGSVFSHYLLDSGKRLNTLLSWFYNDLCFSVKTSYFSVEAADLAKCMITRQGNSTTLATTLMLLAKQLDLELEPLLLPGHTVLCSRVGEQIRYIDPLSGRDIDKHQLHVLVRGALGNLAPFKESYLKPASLKQLLSRMLNELKAGAILSHQFVSAMKCCNLLLQWHPEDLNLNRERAFIAQQLGCISVAATDLKHFIDNSPDDPVTELVKLQLQELNNESEIYH